MICSQCGTQNAEGDRFCENCGAPLAAPAPVGAGMEATAMAGPTPPGVLIRLGTNDEEVYQLGSRAVVGRLDTCDVPVNDKSVSREHALLSRLRDGYVIEDRGSTNGTLVNGTRITEAQLLQPGDIVTIGSIDFRYDVAPAGPEFQPGPEVGVAATMVSPALAEVTREEARARDTGRAEEPATVHDLPPMPVDFPPLEPFAPIPDADAAPQAAAQESAGFATQEAQTEPAAATPSGKDREMAPSEPAPAAEAPVEPAEEPPPVPIATTPPPPSVHAGEEERPSPQVAAAGLSDFAQQAVAAIQSLDDLMTNVSQQRAELEARVKETEERLAGVEEANRASLEEANRSLEAARSILRDAPGRSMSNEQLQSTQDMLDTLIQNPRDVEILMKMGREAATIAAVVNESNQLHRILDRLARELDISRT